MNNITISGLLTGSGSERFLIISDYRGEESGIRVLVSPETQENIFVLVSGRISMERVGKVSIPLVKVRSVFAVPESVRVNEIHLVGNAVSDSDHKVFESGSSVSENGLAVDLDKSHRTFFNLKSWAGKDSPERNKAFHTYITKGRQVAIAGSLGFRLTDDGEQCSWHVNVNSFDLCAKPKAKAETEYDGEF